VLEVLEVPEAQFHGKIRFFSAEDNSMKANNDEGLIILEAIRAGVTQKYGTLENAIKATGLYFRVSILGTCNLHCPFCHNEGAPTRGLLDEDFAENALDCASRVGFDRVQFTGGEPLLHPRCGNFVRRARNYFSDVGITTNGTHLNLRLNELISAGLYRLHISLQQEALVEAGSASQWGVPAWLEQALDCAADNLFILRLNMPVMSDYIETAKFFLQEIAPYGCDVKVFSILPEADQTTSIDSVDDLLLMVDEENKRRISAGQKGKIHLRGYRPPTGIRCGTCADRDRCMEQSHSLRLGADRILRPCLASRAWDSFLLQNDMYRQLEKAAFLALDY
jgi:cyclic pyranopterin phosphate synthase